MEALDPEQRQTADVIMALYRLASELKIRSASKLLQAARGKIPGATGKLASAALQGVTSRQTLAPGARSTGKSAAEDIGTIFQADLLDFSKNSKAADKKSKYALAVVDVFSREISTKKLPDKRSETINQAVRDIMDEPAPGKTIKMSTDKGLEFSNLGAAMAGVVHVAKQPQDRNGIAVLDRGIKTIKGDLAAEIIDEGGNWDTHLESITNAYNKRPHSHTIVPPEDVIDNEVSQFKLLQKNASNFQFNNSQGVTKTAQLRDAGAFRISTPNKRSFNPQWSDKAFTLDSVKGDKVTDTDGNVTLLKLTQAVPMGSSEPLGRLTDAAVSKKARYQERANDVAALLSSRGGEMSLADLETAIRAGEGGTFNLIKLLRRNALTIRNFLRIYPETFQVRNGLVRLKSQVGPSTPPVLPEAAMRGVFMEAADPAPMTPENTPGDVLPRRRRLTLAGGDDAVNARVAEAFRLQGRMEEEEARLTRARNRVRGIQGVYGPVPNR
jgi:hypothetical protein